MNGCTTGFNEGLSHHVSSIPYFGYSEHIRPMSNRAGGPILTMHDQGPRMPKKKRAHGGRVDGKRRGTHHLFGVGQMHRSGFPTFTINPLMGPAIYSAEDFLERNLEQINPDFGMLLRGSGEYGNVPRPMSHHLIGENQGENQPSSRVCSW